MPSQIFKNLSRNYSTPKQVQGFIRQLKYNSKATLSSAKRARQLKTAHCMEAAFLAAAILEQRKWPPLIVSIESWDDLDHVVFAFKQKGLWGAIGRSRDDGLQGRQPVFRSIRDLVFSYMDPYVDGSRRITGYLLSHLDDSKADWRFSERNVWKAERCLNDTTHHQLVSSEARYQKALRRFKTHGSHLKQSYWW